MNMFYALSAVLFVAACVDQPDEVFDDGTDATEETTGTRAIPRLAANGMTPDKIAGGNLNSNRLTQTNADAMSATNWPNPAFEHAVYCALGATDSVTTVINGNTRTYAGGMGLAGKWKGAALSATSASYVSACVLALTNKVGLSVTVSLRGNAALTTTPTELADYALLEGGFWGNVFTNLGPVASISCMGTDQAAGETGGLVDRDCAEPGATLGTNQCLGTHVGLCSTACSTVDGVYTSCSGSSQVLTTYAHN